MGLLNDGVCHKWQRIASCSARAVHPLMYVQHKLMKVDPFHTNIVSVSSAHGTHYTPKQHRKLAYKPFLFVGGNWGAIKEEVHQQGFATSWSTVHVETPGRHHSHSWCGCWRHILRCRSPPDRQPAHRKQRLHSTVVAMWPLRQLPAFLWSFLLPRCGCWIGILPCLGLRLWQRL